MWDIDKLGFYRVETTPGAKKCLISEWCEAPRGITKEIWSDRRKILQTENKATKHLLHPEERKIYRQIKHIYRQYGHKKDFLSITE